MGWQVNCHEIYKISTWSSIHEGPVDSVLYAQMQLSVESEPDVDQKLAPKNMCAIMEKCSYTLGNNM